MSSSLGVVLLVVAFSTFAVPSCWAQLVSATLPSSRSVQVGYPATAFVSVINTGATTALECALSIVEAIPATFTFQTTNPATNQPTGTLNTPASIAAGALQTFVVSLVPSASVAPADLTIQAACSNTQPTSRILGVNTLLFSASTTPVPDIIALVATFQNDGVATIFGSDGATAFAVATVNVGAPGTLTIIADTVGVALPAAISLCRTNPSTGACMAAPGSSLSMQITANQTPTFGIFVQGLGNVPFDPARNRISLKFTQNGNSRGATSVAVRTIPDRLMSIVGLPDFGGRMKIVDVALRDVVPADVFPNAGGACQIVVTLKNLTVQTYRDVYAYFEVVDANGRRIVVDDNGQIVTDGSGHSVFSLLLSTEELRVNETQRLLSHPFGLPCSLVPALSPSSSGYTYDTN